MFTTQVISAMPKPTKSLVEIRVNTEKPLLMGEGFTLLTRGYGFMEGCTPFDTLKIGTSTDDIKLKLYR